MLNFREPDGRLRPMTDPEAVWREIHDRVPEGGFKVFFKHLKVEILPILKEWIGAQGGDDPVAWRQRAAAGQQRHLLEFGDHLNMARAVMGEFLARGDLDEIETQLARDALHSRYLWAQLAALIERLRLRLKEPDAPRSLARLTDPTFVHDEMVYRPLFRKARHLAQVLADPDAYPVEDRVIALHDASGVIKRLERDVVEVPDDKALGTFFFIDDQGRPQWTRRQIKGTEDFRYSERETGHKHYTLKENSGFVMAARVQGVPIWAGPSFTTGRLMRMAEWARATPAELEALAWCLFAFWNQRYPTSSTWVHRFHEVMDMAANWGVPFEPFAWPRGVPPATGTRPRL